MSFLPGLLVGLLPGAAAAWLVHRASGRSRAALEERTASLSREVEVLRGENRQDAATITAQAREIQNHRDLAVLLPEFVKQIFSARKPGELADYIARAVRHMTGTTGVGVFLADRTGRRLGLDFRTGLPGTIPERLVISVGEGHAGFAAETGRIISSEDICKESALTRKQIEDSAIPGYAPEMSAPMTSQGVLFGVICLSGIPRTATLVRERVRAIAAIGAAASENIRLLERFEIAADLDTETALPGANQLVPRLESELERAGRFNSPLSLIELQLPQGDLPDRLLAREVMRMCANHLKATMRNIDTGVRMSRDTFLLLLPGTGSEGLDIVVERLSRDLPGLANEEGDRIRSVRIRRLTVQPTDDLGVDTVRERLSALPFLDCNG